jgi:flagellar biosynthesis protein FlhG
MSVWAIGGGKGGIGKSFISSSLAISLARMGHKVILIDLDLGSANLHTCLGVPAPANSLSDFFSGRETDLNALLVASSLPKMQFIGGFNDALNVANISAELQKQLMMAVRSQLDADYVILDLGAGTHENTLDFFLASDQKITTVVPEPTSIENAYRFIKAAFYRKIRTDQQSFGIQEVIDEAMDHKNKYNIRSPGDLLHYLSKAESSLGHDFAQRMADFQMQIIINQVRTRADAELGHSITSVCQKYFGIKVSYAGYLDYDNAVWQSLRQKRPLLLYAPHTPLMSQFFNISRHLVNPNSTRAVV